MKYLLTVLMVFALITIGCKKNSTESNNEGEINEYSTVNVKTATEYFSFANNSGSTDETAAHDIVFYFEMFTPPFPNAPEIPDPRFRTKDGLSIAVLEDANLEDVTEVPGTDKFITNFVSKEGEWYETTDAHIVVPYDHVYIVNTADGKFPAFEIINYYDDQGNSGIFSIEWKYLSE